MVKDKNTCYDGIVTKEVKDDKEVYDFCKRVTALYKRKLKGDEPTEKEFYDLYIETDRARAGAGAGAGAEQYEIMADELIKLLEEAK